MCRVYAREAWDAAIHTGSIHVSRRTFNVWRIKYVFFPSISHLVMAILVHPPALEQSCIMVAPRRTKRRSEEEEKEKKYDELPSSWSVINSQTNMYLSANTLYLSAWRCNHDSAGAPARSRGRTAREKRGEERSCIITPSTSTRNAIHASYTCPLLLLTNSRGQHFPLPSLLVCCELTLVRGGHHGPSYTSSSLLHSHLSHAHLLSAASYVKQ